MPVIFHFEVEISGKSADADAAFQEVTGLDVEMETKDVREGGENRFVHKLPVGIKQGNLVLKRGLADQSSDLVTWCKETLEGGLGTPIAPETVVVKLLDAEQAPIMAWTAARAYPVKWQVSGLNAMKNEIAIETIEMAYTTLTRTQ